MKKQVTSIVLLGSGYVSVWAYRSLWKSLRREILSGEVCITVVSPEDCHVFHGWTAESITGIIREDSRLSPLSDILPHAKWICGKVIEINPDKQSVEICIQDGTVQTVSYDHLLVGIGSFDNSSISGLTQFGYQIKSHQSLHEAKQKILSLLEQAASDPAHAGSILKFIVAGAGLTGVELIANIAEFILVMKKNYPSLKEVKPVIHLVSSVEGILPSLQKEFPRMVHYAEKIFKKYGIEVIHNSRITEVTASGVGLSCGKFLPASMLISTIGQTRIILKGTEFMARDKSNRLYTNSFLQMHQYSNIWGGGDACHITHYKTREACPANALWAMKHGEAAGNNIARQIKNKPLKHFMYRGLGQTASLGIGRGIGELYGLQFTGWMAWILRWCFFNFYMPSKKVMWKAIYDWMWLLVKRQRIGCREMASSRLAISIAS